MAMGTPSDPRGDAEWAGATEGTGTPECSGTDDSMGPAAADWAGLGAAEPEAPAGIELTAAGDGDGVQNGSDLQTTDSTTIAAWHEASASAGQSAASGSLTCTRATTLSPLGSSNVPLGEIARPSIERQEQYGTSCSTAYDLPSGAGHGGATSGFDTRPPNRKLPWSAAKDAWSAAR